MSYIGLNAFYTKVSKNYCIRNNSYKKKSKESYFNRFLTHNNIVSKKSSNNSEKSIQIEIHNSIYYKYFC